MSGTAYIATSGFTYDDWKGRFYPPEVKKRAWLEYYCQHFDTVEINYSYYHMPRANVCESWRRRLLLRDEALRRDHPPPSARGL